MEDFVKKHGLLIAGGLIGLVVLWYMMGSGSTATAATSPYGYNPQLAAQGLQTQLAEQQLSANEAAANAQANLEAQNLNNQSNATNAAAQIAYLTATGNAASSISNGYANIITAQALIPAQTINTVGGLAQQTLTQAGQSIPAILEAPLNALSGAVGGQQRVTASVAPAYYSSQAAQNIASTNASVAQSGQGFNFLGQIASPVLNTLTGGVGGLFGGSAGGNYGGGNYGGNIPASDYGGGGSYA